MEYRSDGGLVLLVHHPTFRPGSVAAGLAAVPRPAGTGLRPGQAAGVAAGLLRLLDGVQRRFPAQQRGWHSLRLAAGGRAFRLAGTRGAAPDGGRWLVAPAALAAGELAPCADHGVALRPGSDLVGLRTLPRSGHQQHREADGVRLSQRHPAQRDLPSAGPLAFGLCHQLLLLWLRDDGRADAAFGGDVGRGVYCCLGDMVCVDDDDGLWHSL